MTLSMDQVRAIQDGEAVPVVAPRGRGRVHSSSEGCLRPRAKCYRGGRSPFSPCDRRSCPGNTRRGPVRRLRGLQAMNRGDIVTVDFSRYDPGDRGAPALVVQNDHDNATYGEDYRGVHYQQSSARRSEYPVSHCKQSRGFPPLGSSPGFRGELLEPLHNPAIGCDTSHRTTHGSHYGRDRCLSQGGTGNPLNLIAGHRHLGGVRVRPELHTLRCKV